MIAPIYVLECSSPEELSVTFEPVSSFFSTSYLQCTKYAKKLEKFDIFGPHMFGESMDIPLNKPDMIGRLYVVIITPAIRHWSEKYIENPNSRSYNFDRHNGHHNKKNKHDSSSSSSSSDSDCSDDRFHHQKRPKKHWVYWNNNLGHVIAKEIRLYCGSTVLVNHSGEYYEMCDEYSPNNGSSTDTLIGRFEDEDKIWRHSRREQRRVIRLRFNFCENIGKALPVFKLRKSRMFVRLTLRELKECYVSSDNSTPYLLHEDAQLRDTDIRVEVYGNVYYLTAAEKNLIASKEQTYLMHQVQTHEVVIDNKDGASQNWHKIILPFRHLVTGLKFVIQDDVHCRNKDWFVYSGKNGEDPLDEYKLTVNGKELSPPMPGWWWRTVNPLEGHASIPKRSHYYCDNFSIYPDDESFPSGHINMTALQNGVAIHMKIQRGILNPKVKITGTTLNLIRYDTNGEVSLGWADQYSQ